MWRIHFSQNGNSDDNRFDFASVTERDRGNAALSESSYNCARELWPACNLLHRYRCTNSNGILLRIRTTTTAWDVQKQIIQCLKEQHLLST